MNAFWDLMSDRGGMGDGRIKWSAAWAWSQAHELSPKLFDDLWYYIGQLDSEYEASKPKK